jgi:hypothetical protein
MTSAGYTSTDAEVAGLVQSFGEDKVVAIVLQIAYSNFIYRLAQSLALPVEPGGPLPPLEVHFARPVGDTVVGSDVPAAPRPQPAPSANTAAEPNTKVTDPEWTRLPFEELQQRLEAQRGRSPRVSIPSWEEFRKALPATLYPRAKPLRIRWSLLVSGRQPLLGPAWIKTTRTFGSESKQDHPKLALLLLHGTLRDAPGGGGAWQGRNQPANGPARERRLVELHFGRASRLRVRTQADGLALGNR